MPTQNPTTKQQQVLDFIKCYQDEFKYAPSFREIAKHAGISVGTVQRHLGALEARGLITRNANEARSIQLKGNK